MRLIIQPDYAAMSRWAANHVIERINAAAPTPEKPFVLGLPTGSSPEGMYAELVKAYREGRVSLTARKRTFISSTVTPLTWRPNVLTTKR